MSGRTPDHTRLWNFKGSFRSNGLDAAGRLGADWRSLPQVFKDAGWITAGCGKTFHPGSPPHWDAAHSWSLRPGGGTAGELLYPYVDPPEQIGAQGTLLTPTQSRGNLDAATGECCTGPVQQCEHKYANMSVVPTTVCNMPSEDTTDYKTATIAIDRLQNLTAAGKPWFLAVGLHKPHPYWPLPLEVREQYLDLPLPTHRLAPEGMPPVAFVSCDYLQDAVDVKADVLKGEGILPNASLSDALTRKIRSGYAAGVTWMDQQAGRVLDELDRLGQRNNTIVMFTADHGWGLGEHGIWCKYCVFENQVTLVLTITSTCITHTHTHREAYSDCVCQLVASGPPCSKCRPQVRVPMLVRVPWMTAGHGKSSSALIELVDIMPTLADLAGILPQVVATEALDGESFAGVVADPSLAHKAAAYSQYPRCMNSTLAREPPYTPNRDPCVGHQAGEFTHMGLSVRTDLYRYSEWFRWDGQVCAPDWGVASDGIELYSHVGDNVPGCFDCFENVNLAGNASGAGTHVAVITAHRAMLVAHFKQNGTTSCPDPISDEEQAGIDMTMERVFADSIG